MPTTKTPLMHREQHLHQTSTTAFFINEASNVDPSNKDITHTAACKRDYRRDNRGTSAKNAPAHIKGTTEWMTPKRRFRKATMTPPTYNVYVGKIPKHQYQLDTGETMPTAPKR